MRVTYTVSDVGFHRTVARDVDSQDYYGLIHEFENAILLRELRAENLRLRSATAFPPALGGEPRQPPCGVCGSGPFASVREFMTHKCAGAGEKKP